MMVDERVENSVVVREFVMVEKLVGAKVEWRVGD